MRKHLLLLAGTAVAGFVLAHSARSDATKAGAVMTAEAPAQADSAAAREEFTAAMRRVSQRAAEPEDSEALRRYVIYDYLLAARLDRDLQLNPGEDLDARIDTFLRERGNQPVTRSLRNDWLSNLAVRQRWDWFLPRSTEVSTPALICARLAGRIATGDTQSVRAQALARWSQPQRQPPECDPVFAWLKQQGLLTPALAVERTRSALAADNARLAREFASDVPPDQAAPLLQWVRLLETPRPTLTALANTPTAPVEPEALVAGFDRLSRGDAAGAAALLPRLLERSDMTPAMRARLQRSAALGAAYGRDPTAVAAFEALPAEAVDGDVQEWRVRAALWAGNSARALGWIQQMPPTLAEQPRWRYWRARTLAASGQDEPAEALYSELADLRDFYGYLAADRLQHKYSLNAQPSPDDTRAQSILAAEPGLLRAHALFDCQMVDEAGVEWAVVVSGAAPPVKVQASRLAARWGWYAQSIATLAQTGEFDDVVLRYPRPYTEAVAAASKLAQLPPDWILAVMRQESLFRSDVVSRAGARGLMQMQPSTAAAVARRWHLPLPTESPSRPDPDVALGAAYLRELLDRYDGQLGPALAAYNAGSVPVARWLPAKPLEADVWIENIPYGETRNYVQRILEHIVAFAWVRDGDLPRITDLLPRVGTTASYAQAAPPTATSVPSPTAR